MTNRLAPSLLLPLAGFAFACSGALPPEPASPAPAERAAEVAESPASAAESPAPAPAPEPVPVGIVEEAPEEPTFLAVPTACEQDGETCLPSAQFAEQACLRRSSGLALVMFHRDSPWTRAYLGLNTTAWYASGARAERVSIGAGEEVLVLAARPGRYGAPGSYDVMRWDGSCVSVQQDEVSVKKPYQQHTAAVPWKRIEQEVRGALLQDARIAKSNDRRREICRASGSADVACERATGVLTRRIVDFVRAGGQVPMPPLVVQ